MTDPELPKRLSLALGDPVAPYGAKERVQRALAARLATASERHARRRIWLVAFAAAALGVFFGLRFAPSARGGPTKGSLLSLRAARAVLRPDTELVVVRDDARGTSLRLVVGTVLLHVQKGTGRSFEVVAGSTHVAVVGTVFGVAHGADGNTAVEVVEGVVKVTDPNGEHRLVAGERWPARAPLFGDAAELAALREPIAVQPADDEPPPPSAEPAGPTNPVPASPSAEKSAAASAVSAPPRPTADPDQADYARARARERSGDQAGALAAYETLAARPGGIAEDALFGVLRIRARSGEPNAALQAVAQYRSRFPAGRYARDVDVQALNADAKKGDDPASLRECEAFLAQFSDDPRAWRFRLVRAAARAQSGDCRAALADLAYVPATEDRQAVLTRCPKP